MSIAKRVQVWTSLLITNLYERQIMQLVLFQQWATFARQWHIYDCTWQNPFDSAKIISRHLKGMQKPIYHPMSK